MRRDDSQPPTSAPWWLEVEPASAERPADRYVSGGEIGRGGMGVVSGAYDAWLDRDVAVKRIRPELVQAHRERLLREARVTARLVHPGIVPIYDVGEDEEGRPFFTMPVLRGRTLFDAIRDDETSLVWLVRALVAACNAVGYANSQGIVHRDLTPANVLLGAHGQVWVLDWGLAFDPDDPEVRSSGTPGYASPEQLAGKPVTPASDVWSLGAIVAAVVRRGDPVGELPEEPRELVAIVERARATDPAARYADATALGDDLQRWLDGDWVKAHAYTGTELASRLVSRWRAPLAVAAVSALALTALGAWSIRANQVERHRAVEAEKEAMMALAEARESSAAAFQLEARRALAGGFLAEAEIFASRSLELYESPAARGVLMATAAAAAPVLASTRPMPDCRGWAADAAGDRVACWDGDLIGVAPLNGPGRWASFGPALDDASTMSTYAGGRVFGDVLLALRYPARLEVWRKGEVVAHWDSEGPSMQLLGTDEPLVTDGTRLGHVDLTTAEVTWSPAWCDVVLTAARTPDGYAVGCAESVRWGPFAEPGPHVAVEDGPAVFAWMDGLVVGTFHGTVVRVDGDQVDVVARIGSPVRGLTPLGEDRVAVRDERGRLSVWSTRTGDVLARLPGVIRDLRVLDDGSWLVLGDVVRRFVPPVEMRSRVLRDQGEGGVVWLDATPSGNRLAVGHGSGAVDVWSPTTAERVRIPAGPGRISKAGAFVDDGQAVLVSQLGGSPIRLHDARTGREIRRFAVSDPRDLVALGAHHVVANSYGTQLVVLDRRSNESMRVEVGAIAAHLVAGPDAAWVSDESGAVSTVTLVDGAPVLERRFDAKASGFLAVGADRVVHADRTVVRAFTPQGERLWKYEAAAAVTAVEIGGPWVLVGQLDGSLIVLDGEGSERASVQAHDRLISDLLVHDDIVYSASWDGAVKRWNLGALELGGREARDLAEVRHGETAEGLVGRGW